MSSNTTPPKISSSTEVNLSNIQSKTGLRKRFNQWSLGQKIITGYSVAFIITITGIMTGFTISKQAEQEALIMEVEIVKDLKYVSRLERNLIEILFHKQFILNLSENSTSIANKEFQEELVHLQEVYQNFKQDWQLLINSDKLAKTNDVHNQYEHEAEKHTDMDEIYHYHNHEVEQHREITATTTEITAAIMQDHQAVIKDYIQQIDELFHQVNISKLKTEQIPLIQAKLVKLNQSDFITELDSFIAKIQVLTIAIEKKERGALAMLQQASATQVKIMMGSIFLSGTIGILLMYIISRILLRPLKDMTQLTQQSIQESNFDLQVPIRNQDEAGILAQNFNAYINFVKQLLTQHQTTNQELQTTLGELHRTQAQMIQSEKMSSLGQLVAGVAHEINNPVNFIHGNLTHVEEYSQDLLGFVQLYQHHYPNPTAEIKAEAQEIDLKFIKDDLPNILSSMKIGTERIRQIVLSLRNFSRMDEAEVKSVDIHEGLNNTLLILNHRLKARPEKPEIKVLKDYRTPPLVECYPGLLNQVFMNILANGIDAVEEEIKKRTSQESIDHPSQITLGTSLVNNDQWVQITIADNGSGMSPEIQQHIFDPFFTTKPTGKGTGMGMSISYQIITERHKGKLECFSTPGKGTEFVIEIPVRQKKD